MIEIDRLIRNAVLAVGVLLIIGGTAVERSYSAAAIVAGVLLTAAAVTGMCLTRRR